MKLHSVKFIYSYEELLPLYLKGNDRIKQSLQALTAIMEDLLLFFSSSVKNSDRVVSPVRSMVSASFFATSIILADIRIIFNHPPSILEIVTESDLYNANYIPS